MPCKILGWRFITDLRPCAKRRRPRHAYEISPSRAESSSARSILRDEQGWPKLQLAASVKNRTASVDAKIFDSLQPLLSDPNPELRARAAYSIGELGDERRKTVLARTLILEKNEDVKKSLAYALKRTEGKIGPHWKPSAPEPYWVETKIR